MSEEKMTDIKAEYMTEMGLSIEEKKPEKMTRRELRDSIYRIIFRLEFCEKDEIDEQIEEYFDEFEKEPTEFLPETRVKARVVDAAATVKRRKKLTAEEEEQKKIREILSKSEGMDEADKDYIRKKVKGITEKLEEIDSMIEAVSEDWKVARIGKSELAILRLGVYEIKYDDDIPGKVAINEAIELTKLYCEERTHVFINGILSKIMNS